MPERPDSHISDLTVGVQLHQAGRFDDAARCYRAVLAEQPDNTDALHLLGVVLFQNGKCDEAIAMIGRAVAAQPGEAAYHANLALAYRARGELQQAIDCLRTALRLRPDYPEAANNLGLALHDVGRFAEAVAQFDAALKLRPDVAIVHNNRGASLFELRRISDAICAYRAAVELDPSFTHARGNLGQLLVDQGQLEEGLMHCQEAARQAPGAPASLIHLGNAYRALYRWSEAHIEYDKALRLASRAPARKRDLAHICANRGLAFLLEGKSEDAFPLLRRAVDLVPKDISLRRFLANALDVDEQYAAAVAEWQQIIELTPGHAVAHNLMGGSLQKQGRFAEAGECYRRALELDPALFDAELFQGWLQEELGQMAGAEACYRRALTLRSGAAEPLARLAQLLGGKLPQVDLDAITVLLGGPAALSPQNQGSGTSAVDPTAPSAGAAAPLSRTSPVRGPLLFGLARVLDARGSYARAAECLDEANALVRKKRRAEGRYYYRTAHRAQVDQLIAGFTPRLFDRLNGAGDDTPVPIFVFGMPRSGTTLVEQILASHSRVRGLGELRLATEVFDSISQALGRADDLPYCLESLDAAAVGKLARRYLDGINQALKQAQSPDRGQRPPTDRIVDKMPENYLYAGMLSVLFPRAKLISVRRDLRDVALSCWMTDFRYVRWADDQDNLAARIRDYQRLMRHWQTVLGARVHEVPYERLVDDFDTQAPQLLAACGLEWEEACGQFHQTPRSVRTASVVQVRQPLYHSSVQRWKRYERPLGGLFQKLAADEDARSGARNPG